MLRFRFCSIFLTLMLVTVAGMASPVEFCTGTTVNGYPGGSATTWVHGGIQITSSPGVPACKEKSYTDPVQGLVSGLGLADGTRGEIDPGQSIKLDFGGPVSVDFFEVIVLFNGPEHNDPQEIGIIDVLYADGSMAQYFFEAVSSAIDQVSLNTDLTGSYVNLSPMTAQGAGWFAFTNPFMHNNLLIRELTFSTLNRPTSSNNSDYSLKSIQFAAEAVAPIPEPSTYVLLGLGLLGLATLRRRRKA